MQQEQQDYSPSLFPQSLTGNPCFDTINALADTHSNLTQAIKSLCPEDGDIQVCETQTRPIFTVSQCISSVMSMTAPPISVNSTIMNAKKLTRSV